MKCIKCGTEYEGKFCPECGAKLESSLAVETVKPVKKKKPFFLRWWFIVLVVIVAAIFAINRDEKIAWNDIVLGEMVPELSVNEDEVHYNSTEKLWLNISDFSDKQYADYVEACKEKGFTVDEKFTSSSFNAYNAKGYKLSLSYYGSNVGISIQLDAPMELVTIKWPESIAGEQLPVPKSAIGKFTYEHDDNFFVYVGDTSKADYAEYVNACSQKGFNIDYSKGEDYYYADNSEGWHVSVRYEGNSIMSIDIDAPSKSEDSSKATTPAIVERETSTTEKGTETEIRNDDGIDPDFKAAMDSYENFMNEYVEFMKKFSANPSDLSMLTYYADYMSKYAEFVSDFEKWENVEMNAAETAYYIDVQGRVSKKLLEVVN